MAEDVKAGGKPFGNGGKLYRDAREADAKKDADHKNGDDADLPPLADRPDPPKSKAPLQAVPPSIPWIGGPAGPPVEAPKRQIDWRSLISTVVELAGIAAVTTGFWILRPWVGMVVMGILLILFGLALGINTAAVPQRRVKSVSQAKASGETRG